MHRHLHWIVLTALFFLNGDLWADPLPAAERDALIALYNFTNGRNWVRSDGWLGPAGSEGNWFGVTVEDNHVISIELLCNGMQGYLPPQLAGLRELRTLRLSGCPPIHIGFPLAETNLTIAPEIGNLVNLQLLSLTNSQIEQIPPSLGNLRNLREFELRGNNLARLPQEIGGMISLESLDVSSNRLGGFPAGIGDLKQLRYLVATNNRLESLPPEFGNLEQLRQLFAASNQLKSFPPEFGNLAKLEYLDVSRNELQTLPDQIRGLISLREFYILDNQLSSLPAGIGGMANLEILNLDRNQLSSLPAEIGQLGQLRLLLLNRNELTSLPPKLGELQGLAELQLSRNKLENLPPEIGNLGRLEVLELSRNELVHLPPEIGRLQKLRILHLDYNKLETIPVELGNLASLIRLILTFNELTLLPASIGNLQNLQILDASANLLRTLPDEIGNLASLERLSLASNRLTTFPIMLFNLPALLDLELANNDLSGPIPPRIGNLSRLLRLDLSNNLLRGDIPLQFLQLTGLRTLLLAGNALFSNNFNVQIFIGNLVGSAIREWERNQTLAPDEVEVGEVTGRSVELNWSLARGNADRYQVFLRREDAEDFVFSEVEVGSGELSAVIPDLDTDTAYVFVVRTTRQRGSERPPLASEFSVAVEATTEPVVNFYFPFYQGSEQEFTAFAVANYSGQATRLVFTAYDADGQQLGFSNNPATVEVPARQQVALLAEEIFTIPPGMKQAGWVHLSSDNARIAALSQFGDYGLNGLDGAIPFETTSQILYFTRVYSGATGFLDHPASTFLSLANPSDQPATVHLSLLAPVNRGEDDPIPDQPAAAERVRQIPARGVLYGSVDEIFDFQQVLTSGVVRAEVIEGNGLAGFELLRIGPSLVGLNAAPILYPRNLYSAQLANGSTTDGTSIFTRLKFITTTVHSRRLQLSAFSESGSELSEPLDFPFVGLQSFEEDLGELLALGSNLEGPISSGSLQLSSPAGGVAADVLFGDPRDLRFAAALPLETEPFTHAVFSHVANSAASFTGLALYNPAVETVEVSVQVFDESGNLAGVGMVSLAGTTRVSRTLSEIVPGAAVQNGGYIIVRSTGPLVAQELFGALDLGFLSAVPPVAIGRRGQQQLPPAEPR